MVNAGESHGNACGLFISPEGWWILAGGNDPATLHPGGVLESAAGYPIRPISRIRPIWSHYPHPKSTFALKYEPLMRVENSLIPPLSPTSYRPIIRPKNKGIKPKSNRHKPKKFYHWLQRMATVHRNPTPANARYCQPTPATPLPLFLISN